ncbi:MAG: hypothetical protein ACE5G2_05760, partial [Candidatus Krumholzibacteriia bacterium]
MEDLRALRSRALAALLLPVFAASTAFAQGEPVTSSPGTSDKPQSKIWYNDGFYWAILQTSSGSYIFKLVQGDWSRQNFVDSRVNNGVDGREDVLWNGSELFVLVHSSRPKLYKYSYSSSSDTYDLFSGFPISLSIASGSETIVLDQDSTGRLWAAYEGGGKVYVAYSISSDHRSWETPGVVLRSGLDADDIASVVRFGGDKVGVFWSDQSRWEFGFSYHRDSNPPDDWSSVEIVDAGTGRSDDHINLAADVQGRVFAITKDASDEFTVYRRSSSGNWTAKRDISKGTSGTRPIIMLDTTDKKIHALYTCWSCSGPDRISYQVGSMETLSFGSKQTFLRDAAKSMNDVTGMKQILPPGSLVAIAVAGGTAYWSGWGTPPAGNGMWYEGDGEPPPPPPPPLEPPGTPADLVVGGATRNAPPGVVASYLFDEESGETVKNAADA